MYINQIHHLQMHQLIFHILWLLVEEVVDFMVVVVEQEVVLQMVAIARWRDPLGWLAWLVRP